VKKLPYPSLTTASGSNVPGPLHDTTEPSPPNMPKCTRNLLPALEPNMLYNTRNLLPYNTRDLLPYNTKLRNNTKNLFNGSITAAQKLELDVTEMPSLVVTAASCNMLESIVAPITATSNLLSNSGHLRNFSLGCFFDPVPICSRCSLGLDLEALLDLELD